MAKGRTNRTGMPGRILCALLAILLLSGTGAGAGRAESPAPLPINPDLILAQDAADYLDLRGADGGRLAVRYDPALPGRGGAGPEGNEPDYTGVLGFAAIPKDPEIGRSAVFSKSSWQVPFYRRSKDGNTMVKGGYLAHKTPVLVTRQRLKENGNGGYTGWLEIVRLDVREICYLQAYCFVTVPYWDLAITETPAFGYSIAVYRESPRTIPRDGTGKACTFRDGTRVLIPFAGAFPLHSPDPKNLTVQGIVFAGDETGTATPEVLYFREADLTMIY